MKYLLLLNRANDGPPEPGTAEGDEIIAAYGVAINEMAQAGVLVDCAPLTAASSATTVRVRNGETVLTDGPAAELKEQVGGYTIVNCADLDEALAWAEKIPAAKDASVEVRSIVDTGRSS
jgi:hypothetical protein